MFIFTIQAFQNNVYTDCKFYIYAIKPLLIYRPYLEIPCKLSFDYTQVNSLNKE